MFCFVSKSGEFFQHQAANGDSFVFAFVAILTIFAHVAIPTPFSFTVGIATQASMQESPLAA